MTEEMYFDYSWTGDVSEVRQTREEEQHEDTTKRFSNTRRIDFLESKVKKLEVKNNALGRIMETQEQSIRKLARHMVYADPEDVKEDNLPFPITYDLKNRLLKLEVRVQRLERLVRAINGGKVGPIIKEYE